MPYFLQQLVTDGSESIKIYLTEDEVLVGKKTLITLAKYQQVSQEHAMFYKTENGMLYVKNLDSQNGVYVNGARIGTSLKPLSSGNMIGFGVNTTGSTNGFICVLRHETDSAMQTPGIDHFTQEDNSNNSSCTNTVTTSAETTLADLQEDIRTSDQEAYPQIITKHCCVLLTKCDLKYPSDSNSPLETLSKRMPMECQEIWDRSSNILEDFRKISPNSSSVSSFENEFQNVKRCTKARRKRKSSDSSDSSWNENQRPPAKRRIIARRKRISSDSSNSSIENPHPYAKRRINARRKRISSDSFKSSAIENSHPSAKRRISARRKRISSDFSNSLPVLGNQYSSAKRRVKGISSDSSDTIDMKQMTSSYEQHKRLYPVRSPKKRYGLRENKYPVTYLSSDSSNTTDDEHCKVSSCPSTSNPNVKKPEKLSLDQKKCLKLNENKEKSISSNCKRAIPKNTSDSSEESTEGTSHKKSRKAVGVLDFSDESADAIGNLDLRNEEINHKVAERRMDSSDASKDERAESTSTDLHGNNTTSAHAAYSQIMSESCCVLLTKCDSNNFQLPPDINCTFSTQSKCKDYQDECEKSSNSSEEFREHPNLSIANGYTSLKKRDNARHRKISSDFSDTSQEEDISSIAYRYRGPNFKLSEKKKYTLKKFKDRDGNSSSDFPDDCSNPLEAEVPLSCLKTPDQNMKKSEENAKKRVRIVRFNSSVSSSEEETQESLNAAEVMVKKSALGSAKNNRDFQTADFEVDLCDTDTEIAQRTSKALPKDIDPSHKDPCHQFIIKDCNILLTKLDF